MALTLKFWSLKTYVPHPKLILNEPKRDIKIVEVSYEFKAILHKSWLEVKVEANLKINLRLEALIQQLKNQELQAQILQHLTTL